MQYANPKDTSRYDKQVSAKKKKGENAEVRGFFDQFAKALSKGDTETIISMWAIPSYVIGDSMNMAITSVDDIENFFGGAKDKYKSRGISEARPDIQKIEWPTEQIAIVDVRWPYLDKSGRETGSESSVYTLKRDDSGEILLCVALMKGVA